MNVRSILMIAGCVIAMLATWAILTQTKRLPAPAAPSAPEPISPAKAYDQYIKAGSLLFIREDFDGAIAQFTKAIEVNPQGFDAFINRGVARQDKGQWRLALDDYEKARDLAPSDYAAWNNIAWLLATCPDNSIRDGEKAVEFAKQECELTGWKDWSATSTLAAAYAEFGDFPAAVAMQEKTIESAPSKAKDSLQPDLMLYQTEKPTRISVIGDNASVKER